MIIHSYVDSPLGPLLLTGDGEGLTGLYTDQHGRPPTELGHRADEEFTEARTQLDEYFAGERDDFDLPLHAPGTAFQRAVWQALRQIRYGSTMSYRQVAEQIGNPKAVRAVGSANSRNPISIIVPCHRVVGSDGKLVGYAGGFSAKRWLLDHEQATAGLSSIR
ncbi:methylated-DNA--[protein]-cysteine S-methyltransferase [Jatrophihabitans sp.]|jgi:methylated-DNA-[protein]-cysteine S-methyltransferase|uniref:methylated-DNA--[protein]-cysteine S-methyltransferase n=1 Tax=Jatrophihabitans sp. TaxID=1932789 RepID=UPI002EF525A2